MGTVKKGSDEVNADVTFFLKYSKSTSVNILSSAIVINVGRFVTKDVSVFSEKSCMAVFNVAKVKDILYSYDAGDTGPALANVPPPLTEPTVAVDVTVTV